MDVGYFLAFTTGLLGGVGHCIGMCGPFAATFAIHGPLYGQNGEHVSSLSPVRLLPQLLYNTGRITTYSCIGGMIGLSGSFLKVAGKLAGFQNAVAIAAGLMMIIIGMSVLGRLQGISSIEKYNVLILRAVKSVLEGESPLRYYPLGILFGFMPCGLSYSAFVASAAAGGLIQGMFLSFCFGLGTLPAMLALGFSISYLNIRVRKQMYRMSGLVIIVMGIYFLYRCAAAHA